MSFEDVRNALVMAYADDLLDDGEFLFLITTPSRFICVFLKWVIPLEIVA